LIAMKTGVTKNCHWSLHSGGSWNLIIRVYIFTICNS